MAAGLIAGIASAVGDITQGAGTIIQGVSQGTESCGAKPVCAFTKSCKERRQAYQDCVNRSLDIQQQAMMQKSSNQETGGMSITTIVIIAVVIIALIYFLRKKRTK